MSSVLQLPVILCLNVWKLLPQLFHLDQQWFPVEQLIACQEYHVLVLVKLDTVVVDIMARYINMGVQCHHKVPVVHVTASMVLLLVPLHQIAMNLSCVTFLMVHQNLLAWFGHHKTTAQSANVLTLHMDLKSTVSVLHVTIALGESMFQDSVVLFVQQSSLLLCLVPRLQVIPCCVNGIVSFCKALDKTSAYLLPLPRQSQVTLEMEFLVVVAETLQQFLHLLIQLTVSV